jgi:oxazoline/thiazoline dehydrogenase
VDAELSFARIARDDITVNEPEIGVLQFHGGLTNLRYQNVTAGATAAIRSLFDGPRTEAELEATVIENDGMSGLAAFKLWFRQIDDAGLVGHMASSAVGKLVSVLPTGHPSVQRARLTENLANARLSRFAHVRRRHNQVVVESPLAQGRLILHHAVLTSVIHDLFSGTASDESTSMNLVVPQSYRDAVLMFAAGAGLLEAAEETDAFAHWEFADLLLHTRSRLGRHNRPYGPTFRFQEVPSPEPAIKPPAMGQRIIDLPDHLNRQETGTFSIDHLIERRRSVRQYGTQPLTATQLADFLYYACRNREPHAHNGEDFVSRPYPSGGALYDLEIYLVVTRCDGVELGVYRYLPDTHALQTISPPSAHSAILARVAGYSMNEITPPDVLVIVSSRFRRVMWKYESMSYALILKNVGALLQTMYLVATALGLAPCALGGGDIEEFSKAMSLEPLMEGSVGEFALGSLPDGDPGNRRGG